MILNEEVCINIIPCLLYNQNFKKAPELAKGLSCCKKAPVWHPKYEAPPNKC